MAVIIAYISGHIDADLLNEVDLKVIRIRLLPPGRHRKINVTLRHVILALSDQQMVTGIAILGAGFNGLQSHTIQVYHFHIVLYLAWMSSSVHLSALGFLRNFFKSNRPLLLWRMTGMLTLMILLFVGFIPTVSNDWGIQTPWDAVGRDLTGWAVPAR